MAAPRDRRRRVGETRRTRSTGRHRAVRGRHAGRQPGDARSVPPCRRPDRRTRRRWGGNGHDPAHHSVRRRADRALWPYRASPAGSTLGAMEGIIVGVDESDHARAALRRAVDHAGRAPREPAGRHAVAPPDGGSCPQPPIRPELLMTRTYTPSTTRPFTDAAGDPGPDPVRRQPAATDAEVVGPIRRRKLDTVLVAVGAVVTVVLLAAGALLTWGNRFADDYVGRELSSQNISFPAAAALEEEGRTDLLGFAGDQVTTGREAEAYAGYIGGHLEGIAGGATYADLGATQRQ